jgi:hypothetical protein
MEPISPELALIDPALREEARALLPAAPWEVFAAPAVRRPAPAPAPVAVQRPRLPAPAEAPAPPVLEAAQPAPALVVAPRPPAPREAFAPRPPRTAQPAPAPGVPLRPRRSRLRMTILALPVAAALLALALVQDTGTQRPWLADPRATAAAGAPRGASTPAEPGAGAPSGPATPQQPPAAAAAGAGDAPAGAESPTEGGSAEEGAAGPGEPAAPQAPASAPPAAPRTPAPAPGPLASGTVRTFAWAPEPRASYYAVTFYRDGKIHYRARAPEPRLEVPQGLLAEPGTYRWVVMAGFGRPAEARLGATIVESTFTIER